jgi:DNA-binding CsgD family transcriptional regulator
MRNRSLSLGAVVSDQEDGIIGDLPACPLHPGSLVRRYRANGLRGPGVYPQCVPTGGDPHLLAWPPPIADVPRGRPGCADLSIHEIDVLRDAAEGLTVVESAARHWKSIETVKSQRRSILQKLGAHNMTHAVGITARRVGDQ